MDDTAAAITIDLEDIAKAYDRIDGKSSIAFEGLINRIKQVRRGSS